MSKQVRFRRGTTAQHAAFTGIEGEVTVDTDKDVPVVHNGSTAGGFPLLRKDRPRGMTRMEVFTSNGTWTLTNKTDLKRIRVTCYGGGGGGASSGGGGGGITQVILDRLDLTTNVAVTVGAGSGGTGGTTSFGSYINATGGSSGSSLNGGAGGSGGGAGGPVGGGVYILGGQGACQSEQSSQPFRPTYQAIGRNTGGGYGGGTHGSGGNGIRGGGGGGGASGTHGCVIVEEIYGLV
jgi:hypothetical protein